MTNKYCGPFVLGLARKSSPDEAAKFIGKITKERAVSRVYQSTMSTALVWSCDIVRGRSIPSTTLGQWLDSQQLKPEVLYILLITGHYIAIRNRKLFDTNHRDGVWAEQSPYLRRKVKYEWTCHT